MDRDSALLLEHAYLNAQTVEGGSGHGGDRESWEQARGVHAEAVRSDGTFLDTGCANGLLMESMVAWAAKTGYRLEPYGLDISEKISEVARKRLPHWADRIFVGNVMYWDPPMRFDYVCTRLDYVPEWRRRDLVTRLLNELVAPGGRLIVTSYGCTDDPELTGLSIAEHLKRLGFEVYGEAPSLEKRNSSLHRIGWIDK